MRSIQQNLERRRTQLAQQDAMTVKYSVVEGDIPVTGAGETLATVRFPIQFTEKPMFTFGHELADNVWPIPGAYPMVSATVVSWTKIERSGSRQYWTGASVAIVIDGAAAQSILHFHFSGRAFRNPAADPARTTDTL